jgi:DNA-binding response OmpR family regulator
MRTTRAASPAAWVVAGEGPSAARWERLWAALGRTPRRAARLGELAEGRGLALADVRVLRPDPNAALAELRAKRPGLAVLACAGPDAPPALPAAALAAGALDLFAEGDDDDVLLPRLRAHYQRLFPRSVPPGSAAAGRLRLDLRAREARVRRGKAWRLVEGLTAREFDLLAALVEAGGLPLAREALLDVVGAESPEAVDKAVAGLRRKLGPAGRALATVRGYGYRVG